MTDHLEGEAIRWDSDFDEVTATVADVQPRDGGRGSDGSGLAAFSGGFEEQSLTSKMSMVLFSFRDGEFAY